jgi:DNA primase
LERKKLKILQNIFGEYRRSGHEYLFFCPKCSHHKPKLSVNIPKNVFKCWVCDYRGKNILRLIRRHGTFSDRRKWAQFEDTVDLAGSQSLDFLLFESQNQSDVEKTTDLPGEFSSLTGKNLPLSSLPAQKYLKKRGITKADIKRWKIGYCVSGKYENRVVIPSFNSNGNVNFFVARTFNKNWQKYKISSVPKNKIIFNELFLDFEKDLVVVEGAFDAIKTGANSVPLLGSTLSENSKLFIEIVKNDTPVYIALDNDAEKKSLNIIENLLKYDIEVYKVDTSGYEDVAEMTRKIFDERKSNALSMDSSNFMILKTMVA